MLLTICVTLVNVDGYKAKMASSVKTRKALIHEIDLLYYPGNKCNYEAKERSSLKKHKARIHGIV